MKLYYCFEFQRAGIVIIYCHSKQDAVTENLKELREAWDDDGKLSGDPEFADHKPRWRFGVVEACTVVTARDRALNRINTSWGEWQQEATSGTPR